MPRSTTSLAAALVATLTFASCGRVEFERRSEVTYPRVLAIVVDPPVVRPGQRFAARALVATPEGAHLRPDGELVGDGAERRCTGDVCFEWSLCVRRQRVLVDDGERYDPSVPSRGCDPAGRGLASAATVRADGTFEVDTAPLAAALDAGAGALLGGTLGIPPDVIDVVLTEVGVPLTLELRVFAFGEAFVAVKRVLILADGCERDCVGQNPPPPQLAFYQVDAPEHRRWVSARASPGGWDCVPCARATDGSCAPTGERSLHLRARARYVVAPERDLEAWAETFNVLNLTGQLEAEQESAYFAFYATHGRLEQGRTQHPATEEIWRTPDDPGAWLWVALRDGFYGMSACRVAVELEP